MCKIQVKNISKFFKVHSRGGLEIKGYEDVSFDLKSGEFLSLFGPSGMGKSSILKALYRTYTSTSGDIMFAKEDGSVVNIATCSESEMLELRRDEISYVSQFLQVLPRISAVDIVASSLIDRGESVKSSIEKSKDMLNYLSIKEELFDVSPLTFSGGEQQRVNIAKGIIAPKPVLLLDEPTASLDKINTKKVIEKLKEIKTQGVAMVGIFHDQDTMKEISDRIYIIEDKRYADHNKK